MKLKCVSSRLASGVCIFLFCNTLNAINRDCSPASSLLSATTEIMQGGATQASANKTYGIKSGYMKMGSNMGLTSEVWFDDFGNKQREEVNLAMGGFQQKAIIITVDGFRYEYVDGSGQGTKTAISGNPGAIYLNPTQADKERMGMKELGKEKIAGKECVIYLIEKPMKTKTWIWNGIVMKSVSETGSNSMALEVVEIREEKVDQVKFKIPKGVEFQTK